MNLKTLLPKPPVPKFGAYVQGWWGGPGHVGATYKSNNPATVAKQAALMQSAGVEMVNHVFYGLRETVIWESAQLWAAETAKRGMLFSVMLVNDMFAGITTDKTVYLADQMNAAAALFLTPNYIPEHAVWDFGVLKQVDETKLRSWTTNLKISAFWREHADYTWINAPGTRAQQVAYEKAQRANGQLKAPSVWYQFNDADPAAPQYSIWKNADGSRNPVRIVDGEHGNMWHDLLNLPYPSTADYLMVPWDDYNEGTAIEVMLSVDQGIRIV